MCTNRRNFRVLEEIGVEEHDGTSDFGPEVEIWQFRACAMKNMQYNPYLMAESPKFPRLMGNRGRGTR